jgi:type I restriction enzyme S subunit
MPKVAVTMGSKRVAFGDVVKLSRERSSNPEEDGFERYVGLDHIEPGDLKIRRWGDTANGTTFTSVFRPGQVLFGKRRAYQRKVAVADFSGVCSADIYVFEPNNSQVLPELLPIICQTDAFFEHAVGTSAGSLSPRTNWDSLASYEFTLPPTDEQHRLVEALTAIKIAQESLRTTVLRAKAAQEALLQKLFPSSLRATNEWRSLESVAVRVSDGTHLPPQFSESGIPFLFVSNIRGGRIDWKVEKYVAEDVYKKLTRSWCPQRGDVLYSLVGTFGMPAMVETDDSFTFQRHIGLIRTDPTRLLPKYLYWYLRSPSGLRQAQLRAEGLAQKTITLTALRSFRVPVPPPHEQRSAVIELDFLQDAITQILARTNAMDDIARVTISGSLDERR